MVAGGARSAGGVLPYARGLRWYLSRSIAIARSRTRSRPAASRAIRIGGVQLFGPASFTGRLSAAPRVTAWTNRVPRSSGFHSLRFAVGGANCSTRHASGNTPWLSSAGRGGSSATQATAAARACPSALLLLMTRQFAGHRVDGHLGDAALAGDLDVPYPLQVARMAYQLDGIRNTVGHMGQGQGERAVLADLRLGHERRRDFTLVVAFGRSLLLRGNPTRSRERQQARQDGRDE